MDQEKISQETVEDVKSTDSVPDIDPAAEKRLLLKLDIHVVPILMFLFLLAFLDRINIGNARIQGLEKDLGMKGHDYNIALFIFFIPYILFEVPSNLVLKKVPPSWWLSGIMFCWGMLGIDMHVGQLTGTDLDGIRCRYNMPRRREGLWWPRCMSILAWFI
jgi:hypothetical protein